jgi:prevent-host-death family protein
MPTVNMHEAKTQLSKLVEAALAGEDVVIAKAGKPAVRLVPCPEDKPAYRELGSLQGALTPEELEVLLAPLPEEVINSFYESDDDDELLLPRREKASGSIGP